MKRLEATMRVRSSIFVMQGVALALAGIAVHAQTGAELAGARRDVADQSASLALAPAARTEGARATAASPDLHGAGGADFGEQHLVQRERAHVEPWSAIAETQLFHTDNVALTSASRQSDWYLRAGVTLAYTNRIRGPFFVDLSLQQYFFRYNEFDVFDFDLTRFEGGLVMQAPWLQDISFYLRYRLERITEPGFGTSYFTNHALPVGAQKIWKISRGQQIFAGLSADLALDTDPRANGRHEYAASLGWSLRLTERLTAALSYRGSFYDYVHLDRGDWNHVWAAAVTYDVADWLRAGLSITFTKNDSSLAFADYENLSPGASLALRMAF